MHGSRWRREETKPVGNAVRLRRLPPTLPRPPVAVGQRGRNLADAPASVSLAWKRTRFPSYLPRMNGLD